MTVCSETLYRIHYRELPKPTKRRFKKSRGILTNRRKRKAERRKYREVLYA